MTLAPAGYSEKKPATEEIQNIADQVVIKNVFINKSYCFFLNTFVQKTINLEKMFSYII